LISRLSAWRSRLGFWLPALILVVLNLVFLSTYRLLFAGRAQLQAARIERRQAQVEELRSERQRLEEIVNKATENRERVDRLHREWLTPESQRLTRVIAGVKELAHRAGVEYSSFNYPEEVLEEQGLIKRSLVFSVEGSYLQLRNFINLLEVSDFFLILESVRLTGGEQQGQSVRVSMTISTLFTQDEVDREGEVQSGAAGP
jgi:type IV pilus assembly protein PilO